MFLFLTCYLFIYFFTFFTSSHNPTTLDPPVPRFHYKVGNHCCKIRNIFLLREKKKKHSLHVIMKPWEKKWSRTLLNLLKNGHVSSWNIFLSIIFELVKAEYKLSTGCYAILTENEFKEQEYRIFTSEMQTDLAMRMPESADIIQVPESVLQHTTTTGNFFLN